jgi:dihydrofolate reductase
VTRPRVTVIAARARNGAIGRDNALPWRLPEDLQHFKATTLGHPVVMGRRTFESIGRALPGRRTLVVTGDPAWRREGCERVASLAEALARCAGDPEVFVAGGARLYAAALPLADRLILTEVDLAPPADTFFPPFDPAAWRRTGHRAAVSRSGLGYAIDVWERPAASGVAPPAA